MLWILLALAAVIEFAKWTVVAAVVAAAVVAVVVVVVAVIGWLRQLLLLQYLILHASHVSTTTDAIADFSSIIALASSCRRGLK